MKIHEATILVVDDEPELLEIFSIWLKRAGATVLRAPNGEAALKVLDTQAIHALVSDIRMPVMDGVTLVKTLFEVKKTVPTTIFVSGFGEISPRLLYSLGVEALLSKPLPRNLLVKTLEHSLLEREELWIEPPATPAEREVKVSFHSLADALDQGHFGLGRGGCCLQVSKLSKLNMESTVDLHIDFEMDTLGLQGQGIVRWYDAKTQRAGIEFTYLDAGSRRWVISQLREGTPQSFIPACD